MSAAVHQACTHCAPAPTSVRERYETAAFPCGHTADSNIHLYRQIATLEVELRFEREQHANTRTVNAFLLQQLAATVAPKSEDAIASTPYDDRQENQTRTINHHASVLVSSDSELQVQQESGLAKRTAEQTQTPRLHADDPTYEASRLRGSAVSFLTGPLGAGTITFEGLDTLADTTPMLENSHPLRQACSTDDDEKRGRPAHRESSPLALFEHTAQPPRAKSDLILDSRVQASGGAQHSRVDSAQDLIAFSTDDSEAAQEEAQISNARVAEVRKLDPGAAFFLESKYAFKPSDPVLNAKEDDWTAAMLMHTPPVDTPDTFRTVIVTNVPAHGTLYGVLSAISEGLIVSATLVNTKPITGTNTIRLTFLHESSARALVAKASTNNLILTTSRTTDPFNLQATLLPTPTYPLPAHLHRAITQDRKTRIISLSGLDPRMTTKALSSVLSPSGTKYSGIVSAASNDLGLVVLEFSGVQLALDAEQRIKFHPAFRGVRVAFLPDCCDADWMEKEEGLGGGERLVGDGGAGVEKKTLDGVGGGGKGEEGIGRAEEKKVEDGGGELRGSTGTKDAEPETIELVVGLVAEIKDSSLTPEVFDLL